MIKRPYSLCRKFSTSDHQNVNTITQNGLLKEEYVHASPQSEPFQLQVTEHQSNLIIAV